jgi:hypothetical protein
MIPHITLWGWKYSLGDDESVTSTSGAGERNKRARVVVTLNSSGTFDIEFKGTEVANNVKEALVLDIIKSISAKQEVCCSWLLLAACWLVRLCSYSPVQQSMH